MAIANREFIGPKITPDTARAASSAASGGVVASDPKRMTGARIKQARKVRRRGSRGRKTLNARVPARAPAPKALSMAPKLAALP